MRRSDRAVADSIEIEEIINRSDVCRIAIANDNLPYIVTMNFGYLAEPKKVLYFHCASQGRKLDMIRTNNRVCFEMDADHLLVKGQKSCEWGMNYSSILGYGTITIITDTNEKITGLNCIMSHYGREDENIYGPNMLEQTTVLRLEITEMTAKKKI